MPANQRAAQGRDPVGNGCDRELIMMRVPTCGVLQTSTAAVLACKWASGVCMRCVWCTQHARSPLQGRLSSVESSVDGADAGRSPMRRACEFAMFAKVTNDELAAAPWGRRPEAIAAEFSFVTFGVPLFTPHSCCSHPSAAPRHCVLKVLASYRSRTPASRPK